MARGSTVTAEQRRADKKRRASKQRGSSMAVTVDPINPAGLDTVAGPGPGGEAGEVSYASSVFVLF